MNKLVLHGDCSHTEGSLNVQKDDRSCKKNAGLLQLSVVKGMVFLKLLEIFFNYSLVFGNEENRTDRF